MKFNNFLIGEETDKKTKERLTKEGKILTMWQLEDKLNKEELISDKQALSFFCPVYFAGQLIVEQLLKKRDEHDEMILFPLPSIEDPKRIEVGLEQMKILGIKNPEGKLKTLDNGKKALRTFSILPGIEGVFSDKEYPFIAWEAVQLACFSIVPKPWLNGGDPYNDTYKFPGEDEFSPFWRIPPWKEFQKMRPDLADNFKETPQGIVKVDFGGM